jgi:hypothetical protein
MKGITAMVAFICASISAAVIMQSPQAAAIIADVGVITLGAWQAYESQQAPAAPGAVKVIPA